MVKKIRIDLDIECDSEKTAHLLAEATAPDNSPLPLDMELHTQITESRYHAVFTYDKNLSTLRNAIADLLQNFQLVLEVTEPIHETATQHNQEKER